MPRSIMPALAAVFLFLAAAAASAQGWYEPARGTPERRALMDAIRPQAESEFGAPVEFVVRQLRVSGNLAYAYVDAQRPGGARINLEPTPKGNYLDNNGVGALYRRQGGRWVVAHYAIGATDTWWQPACQEFRPVLAEFCPPR